MSQIQSVVVCALAALFLFGCKNAEVSSSGDVSSYGISLQMQSPTSTSSNIPSLQFNVRGLLFQSYRYAWGLANMDCTNPANYSGQVVDIGTTTGPFDLTGYPDDTYKVCVIGLDRQGVWQDFANSTMYVWSLDRVAPTVTVTWPVANGTAVTLLSGTAFLSGTCDSAAGAVYVRGDVTAISTPCTAGSFTATLNFSTGAAVKTVIAEQIDAAGNAGSDSRTFDVDLAAPVVTSVTTTAANGSYSSPQVLIIRVNWSEPVFVSGVPFLTLETGATDQAVSFTLGSGSNATDFYYQVQLGDQSTDLNYHSTTALNLAGAAITDAHGNAAVLNLPALTSGSSLAGSANLQILGWPANLIFSDGPTYDFGYSNLNVANDKVFTVTNIGGVTATSLTASGLAAPFVFKGGTYPGSGGTCGATLATGASCTVVMTFTPTALASFNDTAIFSYYNGLSSITESLVVEGTGSILPVVTGVTSGTADGTYSSPYSMYIRVTFDQVVYVAGTPYISLETGTYDEIAYYYSGSGSNALEFFVYLQESSFSADLELAENSIYLSGASITNSSALPAVLSLPIGAVTGSLSTNKNIEILPVPRAEVSGLPLNISNETVLNTTVGGLDIDQYKYAFGAGGMDCSVATYSAALAVAVPITNAIGSDGEKTICVLGRHTTGVWQSVTQATTRTWIKDTASAQIVSTMIPLAAGDSGTIYGSSWGVNGLYMGEYGGSLEYQYLRYQLPVSLSAFSVIQNAVITFQGLGSYNWNPAIHSLKICGHLSANAPQVDNANDRPGGGGGTLLTTCVRWPSAGGLVWQDRSDNTTVDISLILQELVVTYGGLSSGAYVQFWISEDVLTGTPHEVMFMGDPTFNFSYD